MVISVWMIGVLWLILSIGVYIAMTYYDKDIKKESWYVKLVLFMMCILLVQLGAMILFAIGYILISVFNELITIDWKSFLNSEVIYIK